MSDDLVKRLRDRGDWLVDAVATSTQNRQFLRGEPECDDVACEAIRMNGEMAMRQIAEPLVARIEELEAKLAKAVEGFEKLARLGNGDRYGNSDGNVIAQRYIAELTGGKDE